MSHSNRTVKPDGEKVKRLRLLRGWRVEDLAAEARSSVRTIENVEKSKNCFVFTLDKISKALKIDVSELILGPFPGPAPSTKKRFKVQIILEGDIAGLDETEDLTKLIDLLRKIADLRGDIGPTDMKPGNSVIVTLEMDESDVARLLEASEQGLLSAQGITEISVILDIFHRKCNYKGEYKILSNKDFADLFSEGLVLACPMCGAVCRISA